MRILAVDQARHGAWAVYDYENKTLEEYGVFNFEPKDYTFPQAVTHIEQLIQQLIFEHDVAAVFFEDIQMQNNVRSFKALAQLQGVLINLCEKNEYLYDLISPSKWQNFCHARGRTNKEIKAGATENTSGKKASKMFSLQFVREQFGVETDNDNLADAICIGYYIVNSIEIKEIEYES